MVAIGQHYRALNTRVQDTVGVGESGVACQRTGCSVHHTRQGRDAPLDGILGTVLHDKRHVGQVGKVSGLVSLGVARRHSRLEDRLGQREFCLHLLIAADDGQRCARRHHVTGKHMNLANDTRYR